MFTLFKRISDHFSKFQRPVDGHKHLEFSILVVLDTSNRFVIILREFVIGLVFGKEIWKFFNFPTWARHLNVPIFSLANNRQSQTKSGTLVLCTLATANQQQVSYPSSTLCVPYHWITNTGKLFAFPIIFTLLENIESIFFPAIFSLFRSFSAILQIHNNSKKRVETFHLNM
jgi:hypothetical protein